MNLPFRRITNKDLLTAVSVSFLLLLFFQVYNKAISQTIVSSICYQDFLCMTRSEHLQNGISLLYLVVALIISALPSSIFLGLKYKSADLIIGLEVVLVLGLIITFAIGNFFLSLAMGVFDDMRPLA